jgi:hypothetical protein
LAANLRATRGVSLVVDGGMDLRALVGFGGEAAARLLRRTILYEKFEGKKMVSV